MLPNWLGIGVGRSGTTTLTTVLRKHPDIYMPAAKEAHFFNRHLDLKPIDLASYEAQYFADWRGEPSVGEFTPNYLVGAASVSKMASNMLEHLGKDTKFILSLRHPVRRAYSDHTFFLKSLQTDQMFAQGVRSGMPLSSDASMKRSIYGRPLQEFLQVVPRENLFVTVLEEDIDVGLPATIARIEDFLGLSHSLSPNPKTHINRILPPEIVIFTEPGIASLSERGAGGKPTQIEVPAGSIVMKTGWYPWDRVLVQPSAAAIQALLNVKAAFAEPWDETLSQQLFDTHYAEDVALLEELIGRDLSCWRQGGGSTASVH